jgi:hypothetical protein
MRAALLDTFSFERRELGQDVLLSEVISAIQAVEGVAFVDVDILESLSEETVRSPELLKQKLEEITETLTHEQPHRPQDRITAELARLNLYHTVEPDETAQDIADLYGLSLADFQALNPNLPPVLVVGTRLLIYRGIKPAQLAFLLPGVKNTLILKELSV